MSEMALKLMNGKTFEKADHSTSKYLKVKNLNKTV